MPSTRMASSSQDEDESSSHLIECSGKGVGGNRLKERDRKSELVLRSTYQIFEWDRNFYIVVRYELRVNLTIFLRHFVSVLGK